MKKYRRKYKWNVRRKKLSDKFENYKNILVYVYFFGKYLWVFVKLKWFHICIIFPESWELLGKLGIIIISYIYKLNTNFGFRRTKLSHQLLIDVLFILSLSFAPQKPKVWFGYSLSTLIKLIWSNFPSLISIYYHFLHSLWFFTAQDFHRFDDSTLRILESFPASKDATSLMDVNSSFKEVLRFESLSIIRETSEKTDDHKLLVIEFLVRAFALVGDIEVIIYLHNSLWSFMLLERIA